MLMRRFVLLVAGAVAVVSVLAVALLAPLPAEAAVGDGTESEGEAEALRLGMLALPDLYWRPGPRITPGLDGTQVVGLETWLAVDPATWVEITHTEVVDGVEMVFAAVPARTVWQFSDGLVTCDGPGVEYTAGAAGPAPCGREWEQTTSVAAMSVSVWIEYEVSWVSSEGEVGEFVQSGFPLDTYELTVGEIQTIGADPPPEGSANPSSTSGGGGDGPSVPVGGSLPVSVQGRPPGSGDSTPGGPTGSGAPTGPGGPTGSGSGDSTGSGSTGSGSGDSTGEGVEESQRGPVTPGSGPLSAKSSSKGVGVLPGPGQISTDHSALRQVDALLSGSTEAALTHGPCQSQAASGGGAGVSAVQASVPGTAIVPDADPNEEGIVPDADPNEEGTVRRTPGRDISPVGGPPAGDSQSDPDTTGGPDQQLSDDESGTFTVDNPFELDDPPADESLVAALDSPALPVDPGSPAGQPGPGGDNPPPTIPQPLDTNGDFVVQTVKISIPEEFTRGGVFFPNVKAFADVVVDRVYNDVSSDDREALALSIVAALGAPIGTTWSPQGGGLTLSTPRVGSLIFRNYWGTNSTGEHVVHKSVSAIVSGSVGEDLGSGGGDDSSSTNLLADLLSDVGGRVAWGRTGSFLPGRDDYFVSVNGSNPLGPGSISVDVSIDNDAVTPGDLLPSSDQDAFGGDYLQTIRDGVVGGNVTVGPVFVSAGSSEGSGATLTGGVELSSPVQFIEQWRNANRRTGGTYSVGAGYSFPVTSETIIANSEADAWKIGAPLFVEDLPTFLDAVNGSSPGDFVPPLIRSAFSGDVPSTLLDLYDGLFQDFSGDAADWQADDGRGTSLGLRPLYLEDPSVAFGPLRPRRPGERLLPWNADAGDEVLAQIRTQFRMNRGEELSLADARQEILREHLRAGGDPEARSVHATAEVILLADLPVLSPTETDFTEAGMDPLISGLAEGVYDELVSHPGIPFTPDEAWRTIWRWYAVGASPAYRPGALDVTDWVEMDVTQLPAGVQLRGRQGGLEALRLLMIKAGGDANHGLDVPSLTSEGASSGVNVGTIGGDPDLSQDLSAIRDRTLANDLALKLDEELTDNPAVDSDVPGWARDLADIFAQLPGGTAQEVAGYLNNGATAFEVVEDLYDLAFDTPSGQITAVVDIGGNGVTDVPPGAQIGTYHTVGNSERPGGYYYGFVGADGQVNPLNRPVGSVEQLEDEVDLIRGPNQAVQVATGLSQLASAGLFGEGIAQDVGQVTEVALPFVVDVYDIVDLNTQIAKAIELGDDASKVWLTSQRDALLLDAASLGFAAVGVAGNLLDNETLQKIGAYGQAGVDFVNAARAVSVGHANLAAANAGQGALSVAEATQALTADYLNLANAVLAIIGLISDSDLVQEIVKWGGLVLSVAAFVLFPGPLKAVGVVVALLNAFGVLDGLFGGGEFEIADGIDATGDGTANDKVENSAGDYEYIVRQPFNDLDVAAVDYSIGELEPVYGLNRRLVGAVQEGEFLSLNAAFDPINPFVGYGSGETSDGRGRVLLTPEQAAALRAELGEGGRLEAGDPRIELLRPFFNEAFPNVKFEQDSRGHGLVSYGDLNLDGRPERLQNYVDLGDEQPGDGSYTITALDANGEDLYSFDTETLKDGSAVTLLAQPALNYVASHPDLIQVYGGQIDGNAIAAAARDLAARGVENRGITFDPFEYYAANPDLIGPLGADPIRAARHYIETGFAEGRPTSFDGLAYIASHPDLIENLGLNPTAGVRHFVDHGHAEGRTTTFNPLWFLASRPDLIDLFENDPSKAAEFYIATGPTENPVTFHPHMFLAANPDLIPVIGTDQTTAANYYIDGVVCGEGRPAGYDPANFGTPEQADQAWLDFLRAGQLLDTFDLAGTDLDPAPPPEPTTTTLNSQNIGEENLTANNGALPRGGDPGLVTPFGVISQTVLLDDANGENLFTPEQRQIVDRYQAAHDPGERWCCRIDSREFLDNDPAAQLLFRNQGEERPPGGLGGAFFLIDLYNSRILGDEVLSVTVPPDSFPGNMTGARITLSHLYDNVQWAGHTEQAEVIAYDAAGNEVGRYVVDATATGEGAGQGPKDLLIEHPFARLEFRALNLVNTGGTEFDLTFVPSDFWVNSIAVYSDAPTAPADGTTIDPTHAAELNEILARLEAGVNDGTIIGPEAEQVLAFVAAARARAGNSQPPAATQVAATTGG